MRRDKYGKKEEVNLLKKDFTDNILNNFGVDLSKEESSKLLSRLDEIKLLNNNQISLMDGFIGGAISRIENNIFISGDLRKIDNDNKIRNFIKERNCLK